MKTRKTRGIEKSKKTNWKMEINENLLYAFKDLFVSGLTGDGDYKHAQSKPGFIIN